MTAKEERALQALLTSPTIKAAAAAAGIDYRTMRRYLEDPDFQQEYRRQTSELLTDARTQAQLSLSPAISALSEICADSSAKPNDRIAAARSILEWATKLTELTDIIARVEVLENERH